MLRSVLLEFAAAPDDAPDSPVPSDAVPVAVPVVEFARPLGGAFAAALVSGAVVVDGTLPVLVGVGVVAPVVPTAALPPVLVVPDSGVPLMPPVPDAHAPIARAAEIDAIVRAIAVWLIPCPRRSFVDHVRKPRAPRPEEAKHSC